MGITPKTRLTVEEYLELERTSETRHEYLDGEVFEMVGARENHTLIIGNLVAVLHPQLRRPLCRLYQIDMRVKVSATGLYPYPDVVVRCGTPEFEGSGRATLLNPTLIIEVLTPSTEAYDRGDKFRHYRAIPTLQEYVLISQNNPRIERYLRQNDNTWLFTDATGLDAELELPSIGCTLPLARVYKQVDFEAQD